MSSNGILTPAGLSLLTRILLAEPTFASLEIPDHVENELHGAARLIAFHGKAVRVSERRDRVVGASLPRTVVDDRRDGRRGTSSEEFQVSRSGRTGHGHVQRQSTRSARNAAMPCQKKCPSGPGVESGTAQRTGRAPRVHHSAKRRRVELHGSADDLEERRRGARQEKRVAGKGRGDRVASRGKRRRRECRLARIEDRGREE